eukprot:TRINITY_DN1279_c0_g2_i6.p1 TRINITY_DN1279_c0_g2~~TRINITY_DN1279_c0_g2_i6.p1  ORF type:complete len:215 (-),score=27.63 TRINITY_DN1279_c0_g2_i6:169-813(-)
MFGSTTNKRLWRVLVCFFFLRFPSVFVLLKPFLILSVHGYSMNKNRSWEVCQFPREKMKLLRKIKEKVAYSCQMLNDKSVGKLYVDRRFQYQRRPTTYWEEREDGRLVRFVKGQSSDKDSHGRQARKQKRQAAAKQGKDRVPNIEKSQDSETSNSTTNPNPNILLFGSNSHDRFRSVAICRACGKSGKFGLVTDSRNARMREIFGSLRDESLVA